MFLVSDSALCLREYLIFKGLVCRLLYYIACVNGLSYDILVQ